MRHPKVGFLVQQGLGFPILQIHVYMRVVMVVMILVARGEEAGAWRTLIYFRPNNLWSSVQDYVRVPYGCP